MCRRPQFFEHFRRDALVGAQLRSPVHDPVTHGRRHDGK